MASFEGPGSMILSGSSVRVYDCQFINYDDGTPAGPGVTISAPDSRIENCYFEPQDDAPAILVNGTGRDAKITNNTIFGAFDSDGALIELAGARNVWITNNDLTSGNRGIWAYFSTVDSSGITIADNRIWSSGEEGIRLESSANFPSFGRVTGNFIEAAGQQLDSTQDTGAISIIGSSSYPASLADVNDSISPGMIIADNVIESAEWMRGIWLENASGTIVHDNHVENSDSDGIRIVDSAKVNCHDNLVIWPNTDDAADGIHIDGGESCHVHDNTIVNNNNAGSPDTWRYGINVASGDCNKVVGNDFGDPADYGTDALNDTATNTQLFFPSDATYGDNFTGCDGS